MNMFKWFSIFIIFFVAVLGGYYPLVKRDKSRGKKGLPTGESFTAGVFLALSLVIMLPAGLHLFGMSFPDINYPLAAIFVIASFLFLLALEQLSANLKQKEEGDLIFSGPIIPVIMTIMIAIPSFLLGSAIGISPALQAEFILVAVLVHKGSAGFGLALTMARSTLTRMQTYFLYLLFALSTPFGIFVGADISKFLRGDTIVIVKAVILSLAAGVFLYMSTVHGLRRTALVEHCSGVKGFSLMFLGLVITALVRLVLGLAHAG
ncbi:MAG: ZIP family metal transporter [Candidatus Omnitrophota bacterium]